MLKKIFTTFAILASLSVAKAQLQTPVLSQPQIMEEGIQIKRTTSSNDRRNSAGPSWFEPSEAIRNLMGGATNDYFFFTIFPDTNHYVGYSNSGTPSYTRTGAHSIGIVFDARSNVYSGSPFQASRFTNLTVDSLRFQALYRRGHPFDEIKDTILVTTFDRASISRHFTSIYFGAVDYNRNGLTVGGTNVNTQVIELGITDTAGIQTFSLPVNRTIDANSSGFNWLGAAITFIPGKKDYTTVEPFDTIYDFTGTATRLEAQSSILRVLTYADRAKYVEDPDNVTFVPAQAGFRVYNHGIVAEKQQRYGIGIGTPPSVPDYYFPASYQDFNAIPAVDFLVSTNNLSTVKPNFNGYGIGEAFPNPAENANTISIPFSLGANQQVTFKLTDITGKVVRSNTASFEAGKNTASLDIKGLTTGVYFCQMQAGAFSAVTKVVIK